MVSCWVRLVSLPYVVRFLVVYRAMLEEISIVCGDAYELLGLRVYNVVGASQYNAGSIKDVPNHQTI